jgi:hypothetical protein
MKTHKRAPLLSALLVFSLSPQAIAEPITAVFDVTVNQRQLNRFAEPGTPPPSPFGPVTFSLLMTFDPARGTEFNPYGLLSFSEVPLEGASPVPGVPFSQPPIRITRHGSVFSEDLIADVSAEAIANDNQFGEDFFWDRLVQMHGFVFDVMGPLPPFTPETFPVHLGTQGDAPWNFVFRSALLRGEYTADSFTYFGTAAFRELLTTPEPIPEPATLLLVGGGLAVLAKRRRDR